MGFSYGRTAFLVPTYTILLEFSPAGFISERPSTIVSAAPYLTCRHLIGMTVAKNAISGKSLVLRKPK
jgi:hypothetical protein